MGSSFEELIRALLLRMNSEGVPPFKFAKIGGFWTRKGDVEVDVVAINEEDNMILFGECKLKGSKFTKGKFKVSKKKQAMSSKRIWRYEDFACRFIFDNSPIIVVK